MSKIFVISDVHLRTGKCGKRLEDDILNVGLTKLRYLGEQAKLQGASAIVCTGDLGHYADWKSVSMFWKVYDTIKALPVPFYTVVGNHDVPGRLFTEYKEYALGYLEKYGAIHILHPNNPTKIGNIQLWGFHADTQETENLVAGRFKPNKKLLDPDCMQVAIVHANVGEDETPWQKGHKSLYIPHFNYALFGDIHTGFKPYQLASKCTVANPGCLVRTRIDEANVKPSYLVIDKTGITVKEVPHTVASKAFDLSSLKIIEKHTGKSFSEHLKEAMKANNKDPYKYVLEEGLKHKYSKESIELLQEEIKK